MVMEDEADDPEAVWFIDPPYTVAGSKVSELSRSPQALKPGASMTWPASATSFGSPLTGPAADQA